MSRIFKCKYAKKLNAYIDSELSKKEFTKIQEHLKDCLYCQKEIREINKINAFLSGYQNEDVPENLNEKILSSVGKHSINERKAIFLRRVSRLSIAASILFSLFSGIILSNITFSNNSTLSAENTEIEFAQDSLYDYLLVEE
ncbi:MAG TPA: hypothetical protein ENL20_03130 [Candidatus Cloacimonetes bacterium]|nr:hypothetical protein [Candidatus Cloacimonadota bacterium]